MSALETARAVFDRTRQAEVPFMAAAIAYYALVSVVPALLLAITVAAFVGGAELAAAVAAATGDLLTPAGRAAIEAALTGAAGRGVSILGLVVLAWTAIRVLRGLDAAFSRVYGLPDDGGLLDGVRDGLVAFVAVGVGLWAMLALGGVLAALSLPIDGVLVGLAALLAGLFVVFLPVYVVFAEGEASVREAAPGAAVSAVGWVALQAGFQLYVAVSPAQLYGVLGGILLLVTWFYLGAAMLLVGAALNAELAGVGGDRQAEMPADRPLDPTMDADDDRSLEAQVGALREAVEALEARLEDHTVPRSTVEADLERYVRSRVRRGHARGWGPYLVLLYGTAMTVGAFYFLSGGWAILAMLVVWLSTLGLYVVMVLTGVAGGALDLPGRAVDAVRDRRR